VNWWDDFWTWAETSQLGSNVVGGLIVAFIVAGVALVASVVKKSWRDKIWGSVARIFGWLGTLRVTTTARIEKEYERGVDEGWAGHEREVEEQAKPKKGISIDFTATREDVQREVQAPPPAPQPVKPRLPPPRWSIRRLSKDDPKKYVLVNYEVESVATDVRLDAPADVFDFYDKARWNELEFMGEYSRENFYGHVKGKGRSEGVMFTVTWQDENGHEQSAPAHLERQPRQAIVLS
jgi:hypothetical protein